MEITVVILVRDRCPRGKGNLPRLPIRTNIVRLATPSMGIQMGAVTGTDIQKESQKQTKPSTGWKRQSQTKAKVSQSQKINPDKVKGQPSEENIT
ncbi:hypothetical protein Tco_0149977 [Tanacetum coccineum]